MRALSLQRICRPLILGALALLWHPSCGEATVKVALVQHRVASPDEVGSDATQLEYQVRQAATNGAVLIVLPETCFYRYAPWSQQGVSMADLADRWDTLCTQFSDLADELDISIVMGLREPHTAGSVYNTAVCFGPEGALLGKHRKLLPSEDEKQWTRHGTAAQAFATPIGRVGMLICKDVRGESEHRVYANQSIDLLIVIAADPDGESLDLLDDACVASRAYGLLCNQLVKGGKGNSAVLQPDGTTDYLGSREGVFYADLALALEEPPPAFHLWITRNARPPER